MVHQFKKFDLLLLVVTKDQNVYCGQERLLSKNDSFVILKEKAITWNNVSLSNCFATFNHLSYFSAYYRTMVNKFENEARATKKVNGYLILNTATLDKLWLSEYDFNNMVGYYSDLEKVSRGR